MRRRRRPAGVPPPTRRSRCWSWDVSARSCRRSGCFWWCRIFSGPKPPNWPMWCCPRRRGVRRPAPSTGSRYRPGTIRNRRSRHGSGARPADPAITPASVTECCAVVIAGADAADLGISEGDLLELTSPRGTIRAHARVSRIRRGVLFVPFHYGYGDAEGHGHDRAANEMTVTDWDPVSKQPLFKTSVAAVRRLARGSEPARAPTNTSSAPLDQSVPPTRGGAQAMADSDVTATRSSR
nr:molybdopterin dinucleotide binding domain-containing protein [Nocardia cyriacigeorgica]